MSTIVQRPGHPLAMVVQLPAGRSLTATDSPKDDEVQKHVDAVVADLTKDKVRPQQVEQVQRAIHDAAVRRAMSGRITR